METAKYRSLTLRYCMGNGVDIGSQDDPIAPWAICVDLPDAEYARYSSGQARISNVHWRGDGRDLPFKDRVLDFVYSSHLLEDFAEWEPVLREWTRVLKSGGHLIILVPDKVRWNYALHNLGQPPNDAHRHESYVGELSKYIDKLGGFEVIADRLTDTTAFDYTILFIAKKK